MSKPGRACWAIIIVMLALGIYFLKYDVRDIRKRNEQISREIAAEREAIAVLRAEWAYLNRPERLAKLAERYLDLVPMTPAQLAHWQALPKREATLASAREAH